MCCASKGLNVDIFLEASAGASFWLSCYAINKSISKDGGAFEMVAAHCAHVHGPAEHVGLLCAVTIQLDLTDARYHEATHPCQS